MRVGAPFLEIIHAARTEAVDLIVLGTHGRTGLAHVLLGSVAERVVQKAGCAVLTVRHPDRRFKHPLDK
jgi:nucleotide-binding universal stress UspA family protein